MRIVVCFRAQSLAAGLIAGLVYNLVYVRTGNVWMPIISHATTNTVLGVWILATGNWQFW